MLQSINNLAFRAPLVAASALLIAGCYTMFSHPETELVSHEPGNDCESCHSTGFAAETFASPYSYDSTPFLDYYEVPWWIPSLGGGYVTGDGSGEGDSEPPRTNRGRHVGSRGQRASTPPPPAASTDAPPPTRSTTETKEDDPAPEPAKESGQQSGRRMKKDQGDDPRGQE